MNVQIKSPFVIGAAVALLVAVVAWGVMKVGSAGNLDHGQVAYTPGVPPWLEKDPAKRGPGVHAPAAPAASAPNAMPEGPPVIGNSK